MASSINVSINFQSTSDGWRGKLADNFNFQNIRLLGEAISRYLTKDLGSKEIVIGYDTRFMSCEFANFLTDIFINNGINVYRLSKPRPTPFLSFSVVNKKTKIGLMVTASHNPPFDNGIKIRMGYGGAPSTKIVKNIEKYLWAENTKMSGFPKGQLRNIDPTDEYIEKIKKMTDLNDLPKKPISVLVDTMHGTTLGLLKKIVKKTNIKVSYINSSLDPYFGKFPPEPKFETTFKLQKLIQSNKYNLGIAHDGDGDRIVAVSPKHGYLSPHDVSAIILWYLVSIKKISGKVVGSSTLGRRVRMLSQHFGLQFQEIPVGFKNATKIMLNKNVLLAAEENGGIGFGFYLPERDAILAATVLCQIEAMIAGGIDFVLEEIKKVAGESGFSRYNYISKTNRSELMAKINNTSENKFALLPIKNVSRLDGVKITFKNNDWVSIRFSETENIIRIYAESNDRLSAEKIIAFIKNLFVELDN